MDLLNQGRREMERIRLFVATDRIQLRIRGEAPIRVPGPSLWKRLQKLVPGLAEEKAHSRPGRVDPVLGEQLEHSGDRRPNAEQVVPVTVDGALVAHAPVELEVER